METLLAPYEYSLGYIILTLPPVPHIPAHVTLAGRSYKRKPKLHCSLVAVKKLVAELVERDHVTPEAAEKKALEITTTAINKHAPTFEAYRNELRLADRIKDDRHTLLVMAHVEGLTGVFNDINHDLQLEHPTQPAHVTLYTAADSGPIGVTSAQDLGALTRPLTRAEVETLEDQIDPYKSFRWSALMAPALVRNNLVLELHVPEFKKECEFYKLFGFTQIAYDPISGGGDSDLGYIELKREDSLGRAQINFYGDKEKVSRHAHFDQFPANTPRGYGVEITIPVEDVAGLWETIRGQLAPKDISQQLEVKRWGKLDFRVVDPCGFYVRFTEPVDWWQDI